MHSHITPRVWINDKIINYMGRVLTAPNQNTSQTKVHLYPTFFMSRLHSKCAGGRGYKFKTVRTNDSRIERSLGSPDDLHIPTNVNSAH